MRSELTSTYSVIKNATKLSSDDLKISKEYIIPEMYDINEMPSSCIHCSNHPRNGGSGICHCTLGNIAWSC